MKSNIRLGAPEWLVVAGSLVFIVVLAVSAWWETDIRWLHFFQAWMYVLAVVLIIRGSKWGAYAGVGVAGLWAYGSLFVTNFFESGLRELSAWIHTGSLARPDQLIAVPGWTANLLVVVGCVWAYVRRSDKRSGDLAAFLLTFVLSTAFFAADMALFQPRYLALFPRMLHPHLP